MPIPNEQFKPGVVSNSFEIQQVKEWIAGRPVPTLSELGFIPKHDDRVAARRDPTVEVGDPVADGYNVKPSKQSVMNHLLRRPAFVLPDPSPIAVKVGRPPIRGVTAKIVPKKAR